MLINWSWGRSAYEYSTRSRVRLRASVCAVTLKVSHHAPISIRMVVLIDPAASSRSGGCRNWRRRPRISWPGKGVIATQIGWGCQTGICTFRASIDGRPYMVTVRATSEIGRSIPCGRGSIDSTMVTTPRHGPCPFPPPQPICVA
jgi:hypothetical protein